MAIQVPSAAEEYLKRQQPAMGESYTPAGGSTMVRETTPAMGESYTPPAQTPTNTPPPQPSSLDTSVNSYLTKTAENLGKPSNITEAGSLYADRVTNSLKTPDASSVNAQATEDTAAARRAYLARVNSEERVGQSGFGLGSAQATRIADQSAAGVNAANQAGQSAVNDYIRQRTELNLNRARGLEADQQGINQTNLQNVQNQSDRVYGRGRDTVMDTRYADETKYARDQAAITRADALDQRNWERERVIRGDSEAEKANLLRGLPEGPAKNAATQMLSQGKAPAEVLAAIFNPDGSVKQEYRGKTPGTLGMEAEKEYAIQTLQIEAEKNGIPFDPNSPEGIKAIATKILSLRKTKENPITDQEKQELAEAGVQAAVQGQMPTAEQIQAGIETGMIKNISPSGLPRSTEDRKEFLRANSGKVVVMNGTPYLVSERLFNSVSVPVFIDTKTGTEYVQDGETIEEIPEAARPYYTKR